MSTLRLILMLSCGLTTCANQPWHPRESLSGSPAIQDLDIDMNDPRYAIEPIVHECPVLRAVLSHNDKLIATGTNCYGGSGKVSFFDAANGEQLGEPIQYDGAVHVVAFSADDSKVLIGSDDGSLDLIDTETREEIFPTIHHNQGIWRAVFNHDETHILTGTAERGQPGFVHLIDALTGKELLPAIRHESRLFSVAFSEDGKRFATGDGDGNVGIFDSVRGTKLSTISIHEEGGATVAFSKDGTRILAGAGGFSSGSTRLIDLSTGADVFPPITHLALVWTASFSHDESKIVSGTWGETLSIIDANTGKRLVPSEPSDVVILSAAFSNDDREILIGTAEKKDEGRARLVNASTGEDLIDPLKHQSEVWTATFNKDENLILTGSQDGTARLWRVQR